ncbi:MAG: thioredoxin family protein [Flavobacteriales bacterium]|nr:thioredoxin family protein [Flavobacteriales bacterium]
MHFIRTLIVGIFISNYSYGQLQTYSFEEVDSLRNKEAKPTLIFLETSWCKYCKQMKNTTLQNEDVLRLLNTGFYFIRFDAEQEEEAQFMGRTFKFNSSGNGTGVHELAEELGTIDGKLNYPSTIILNEKNEIVFQYSGLIKQTEFRKSLEALLSEKAE